MFTDFLLDENGDLLIQNGDLVVGPSDNQHIDDIISSFAGFFKENPNLGVGINQDIKSQNGKGIVNTILQQLQSDGYQVPSVDTKINNGVLTVSFPNGISRNG